MTPETLVSIVQLPAKRENVCEKHLASYWNKSYLVWNRSSTLLGLRNIRTGLGFQEKFWPCTWSAVGWDLDMDLSSWNGWKTHSSSDDTMYYKPFSARRSTMHQFSASFPLSRTCCNCYKFWYEQNSKNQTTSTQTYYSHGLIVQIHRSVNIIKYI